MGDRFKRGTYTIAVANMHESFSPETIEGTISPDGVWGILHERWGRWVITHIPTGHSLTAVSNEAKARKLCAALSDDPRWREGEFNKPPAWASKETEMHRKLQDELDKL